jgi:hypothetical protein
MRCDFLTRADESPQNMHTAPHCSVQHTRTLTDTFRNIGGQCRVADGISLQRAHATCSHTVAFSLPRVGSSWRMLCDQPMPRRQMIAAYYRKNTNS